MLLQIAAVITLVSGTPVSIPVRNPGLTPATISFELRHGTIERGAVMLGREVIAVISPREVTLRSGETQTIRILLREVVPHGTVLRFVVTFVPAPTPPVPGEPGVSITLTTVTRLIGKALVP